MIDLQSQTSERATRSPRKQWGWIVGVVLLVGVVGYLTGQYYLRKVLSTWSRARLESVISENMNRQVHLGSVRWSVGLPGIIFHADKITINELNGKPFVEAGRTEIAVALIPLIRSKELMLSNLNFTNPEIWATRLSNTKWNFSDLPELPALKDLSHLGVHAGRVHITDIRRPKMQLDFESIEAKMDRPFYRKGWPFAISMDLKHPSFTTHFEIDGTGHGDPKLWKDNQFAFNAKVKDLVLADFEDFTGPLSLPDIGSPINATFSGEGIPNQGIKAKTSIETPKFTLSAQKIEETGPLPFLPDKDGVPVPFDRADLKVTNVHFEYPQGKLAVKSLNGEIHLTREKLAFEKTKGRLGHSEFEADGWVDANRKADIRYHGKHIQLDEVRQTLDALKIPAPDVVHQPMYGTVKEALMTLQGDLTGNSGSPRITLNATPEKLYYMPREPQRLFELGGGKVDYNGTTATFTNLTGKLGRGSFSLDGTSELSEKGKVDVRVASNDIDLSDVKTLLKEAKIDSPLVNEQTLYGRIRSARGEVKGSLKNPSIALKVVPINLYYQPTNSKTRIFEVNGGEIGIVNQSLDFRDTSGTLGNGKFWLNGSVGAIPSAPVNVKIRAENIDLSNVKMAMQAMKVQSPLLAEQLLYGVVKKVDLSLSGSPKVPTISMTALPKDITYQPLGSSRAVHLMNGKVIYDKDTLSLQDVDVSSPRSRLRTSLSINNLSKATSSISSFSVDTPNFDLSDLHSYLAAANTPKPIRDRYLKEMSDFNITPPKGKVRGHVAINVNGGNVTATGDMSFDEVAARVSGFPISHVKGHFLTAGKNLNIDSITGNLGKTDFNASGSVTNFTDKTTKSYNIKVLTHIDLNDFFNVMGQKQDQQARELVSSGPLPITAQLTGTEKTVTAVFQGSVPANQEFSFVGPFGTLSKPKTEPATASGTLMLQDNKITLQNVQLQAGIAIIRINGVYNSPTSEDRAPNIDITLDLPNPIQAKNLIAFLPAGTIDSGLKNLNGSISGSIEMKGPTTAPAVKGSVHINDFGVPAYKLFHVTGDVSSNEWVTGNAAAADERQSTPFDVNIQSMTLNKLPVKGLKGKLVAGYYTSKTNEKVRNISLKDITADIAKGKLKMRGWTAQDKALFGGTADLSGVDANVLFTQLFDLPNEITGTLQSHIRFRADISPGKNVYDTLEVPPPDESDMVNLGAHQPSSFKLENGRVSRFSLLQRRIDQANLIKGGLVGFNINNFLQSVAPVKNGNYKTIAGTFVLKPGLKVVFGNADPDMARFGPVEFNGDELRMRSSGNIDFKQDTLKVDVVGNIPRTSTRGFLGKVGPMFSIGGILDVLDGLPIVPNVWPDNKPRAFSFKISGTLDNPNGMNKSIYDSFKWLPNQKDATPHPTLAGANTSASG
ncbi:MAG: hypothetical protein U0103_27350 [Candidatus Obscuribacterales bacterium]